MPRTSTKPAGRVAASPLPLDEHVGHLLRRAYQRATENLGNHIGHSGLSTVQFAVLARLFEQGPVSQNRLGRLVAMDQANIHDVVRRLKRRRLLRTARDPLDRRLTLVSLTRTGTALIRDLNPRSERALEQTLGPLNGRERHMLYDLLRRVADARKPLSVVAN